jgi:dTDP-3-amino-3,4,6-trideoxy-alpha-D-glucose transaminase
MAANPAAHQDPSAPGSQDELNASITKPAGTGSAYAPAGDQSHWHAHFGPLLTEAQSRLGETVSLVRMTDLQIIPMPNGSLSIAEVSKHIGFPVHRTYFITDVPAGEGRGAHGHRNLRQCFVCLKGRVNLAVTRGETTQTVRLGATPQAAVVGPGCWRDLSNFSPGAVVFVMASEEYDEADYIRDPAEFAAWERGETAVTSVPYVDLARQAKEIGPELELAMRRVVKSGRFIGGGEVERFEETFAAYCGGEHMVGVGNGLEALSLILRAWGIGPGDEVITPAHTFIATALAVDAVGATPVLVDVEADTGLIDVDLTARAITERTRAVLPVHLYGHPADMDGLRAVLGDRDIFILEDAAQAHGARYKGRRCGGLGDAAAFSFYPTKNLGALGDGGAIVTDDGPCADRARRLANYGSAAKYVHEVIGGNSRLDPLQAAVLSVKLERLDRWNERRRALAALYLDGLAGIDGLCLPAVRSWAEPVWHVFAVRAPGRRDALQAYLETNGVGVNIHYPTPVHLQPCYAGRWRRGQFPVAEAFGDSLLSLPLDPHHTASEIGFVIDKVRAFFRPTQP